MISESFLCVQDGARLKSYTVASPDATGSVTGGSAGGSPPASPGSATGAAPAQELQLHSLTLDTFRGHRTPIRGLELHPSAPVGASIGTQGGLFIWALSQMHPSGGVGGGTGGGVSPEVPEGVTASAWLPGVRNGGPSEGFQLVLACPQGLVLASVSVCRWVKPLKLFRKATVLFWGWLYV